MKETKLQTLSTKQLVTLKRNPQYMTPKQMESLKESIKRDGFCAPILVRKISPRKFEVISGNHRFMAAVELGYETIHCVVAEMTDRDAKRLAINLNTIHGEPNAELLAPFLADMDIDLLRTIHIEEDVKNELMKFDAELSAALQKLQIPDAINNESNRSEHKVCTCPKCGTTHIKKNKV